MTETSYNGWPASREPKTIGVAHLDLPGKTNAFPPGVKKGDVATVLGYVAAQIHARVEPLGEGCWGYNYRRNRNANNLSCHASGTAIDINAPKHPNGKKGTWTAKQTAEVRKILSECGGVVKWGEDFRGTVDGMHFEIHGDAGQVKAAAVRLRKKTQPAAKAKPATTPAEKPAPAPKPKETRRMDLFRMDGSTSVYQAVGSHLEGISGAAFKARGLSQADVQVVPATHPIWKLEKR
jgi:hypothetical protein